MAATAGLSLNRQFAPTHMQYATAGIDLLRHSPILIFYSLVTYGLAPVLFWFFCFLYAGQSFLFFRKGCFNFQKHRVDVSRLQIFSELTG